MKFCSGNQCILYYYFMWLASPSIMSSQFKLCIKVHDLTMDPFLLYYRNEMGVRRKWGPFQETASGFHKLKWRECVLLWLQKESYMETEFSPPKLALI